MSIRRTSVLHLDHEAWSIEVRPIPSKETIMKIKTKVKAGPRGCGGGGQLPQLPVEQTV